MEIVLSKTEFETANALSNYRECSVANLKLPIGDERYELIREGNDRARITNERFKFTIVIDKPKAGYSRYNECIRFIDCVLCSYGQYNGFENIQINFWATEKLSEEDRRNVLLHHVLEV
jgi:hypothetical protein